MDAQAAKKAMEARLAELNRMIAQHEGVNSTEGMLNLHEWCKEADQLEEMLQPSQRGFGS